MNTKETTHEGNARRALETLAAIGAKPSMTLQETTDWLTNVEKEFLATMHIFMPNGVPKNDGEAGNIILRMLLLSGLFQAHARVSSESSVKMMAAMMNANRVDPTEILKAISKLRKG